MDGGRSQVGVLRGAAEQSPHPAFIILSHLSVSHRLRQGAVCRAVPLLFPRLANQGLQPFGRRRAPDARLLQRFAPVVSGQRHPQCSLPSPFEAILLKLCLVMHAIVMIPS